MGGGEVLRISFGAEANAVSSHLVNLEGLACSGFRDGFHGDGGTGSKDETSVDATNSPLCDPYITHSLDAHKNLFRPRSIFVDFQDSFGYDFSDSSIPGDQVLCNNESRETIENSIRADRVWGGKVNSLDLSHLPDSFLHGSVTQSSLTSEIKQHQQQHPFALFHQEAQAFSYRAFHSDRLKSYSSHERFHSSLNDNSTPRHVDWDNLEEEGDEDEYEEGGDFERDRRRQREAKQKELKQRQQREMWQQNMTLHWESGLLKSNPPDGMSKLETNSAEADVEKLVEKEPHSLSSACRPIDWRDYLLPPYPRDRFMIHLPLSWASLQNTTSGGKCNPVLSSYSTGFSSLGNDLLPESWRIEHLYESLRLALEDCDMLRGLQFVVSDKGLYGGLAASFVEEEILTECKSAARMCLLVNDDQPDNKKGAKSDIKRIFSSSSSSSGRDIFRCGLNEGLTFHGLAQHAHLTLPLSLSSLSSGSSTADGSRNGMFFKSASTAAALECATLSYRLRPQQQRNSPAVIGMAGGVGLGSFPMQCTDESVFSTYNSLNIREFMASLRGDTTRHSIIELDANTDNIPEEPSQDQWKDVLYQGTSVLVDPRQPPKRDQVSVKPGNWITRNLKSFSYATLEDSTPSSNPRSDIHTQFSIMSSFRFPSSSSVFESAPFQKQRFRYPLLQSIMEGVAQETRPVGSYSTCLTSQSFGELTSSGYGYWRSTPIFSFCQDKKIPLLDRSVVAMLGNSTRIHPLLSSKYMAMQHSLSRFGGGGTRGFYSTDLAAGLVPDLDDCDEALEFLKDLDSRYCPPGENSDNYYEDTLDFYE